MRRQENCSFASRSIGLCVGAYKCAVLRGLFIISFSFFCLYVANCLLCRFLHLAVTFRKYTQGGSKPMTFLRRFAFQIINFQSTKQRNPTCGYFAVMRSYFISQSMIAYFFFPLLSPLLSFQLVILSPQLNDTNCLLNLCLL